MLKMQHWLALAALAALTGCTGTLTNLTPHFQNRRADGLYPVSVAFDTEQQSLRWASLKPYVIADNAMIPMRQTPLMTNRWETLLPVPAGKKSVEFRYKMEWEYNAIPVPEKESMISQKQVLTIIDR